MKASEAKEIAKKVNSDRLEQKMNEERDNAPEELEIILTVIARKASEGYQGVVATLSKYVQRKLRDLGYVIKPYVGLGNFHQISW